MQPARVLGAARATVKHASLQGRRLVIAQPLGVDDQSDGPPLIVIDVTGCRPGDRVMITSDGLYAREVTGDPNTPARWSVLGIED